MNRPILEKRYFVLEFIRNYAQAHAGKSPSVPEIMTALGYSCSTTVITHISNLVGEHLLVREQGAVTVTSEGMDFPIHNSIVTRKHAPRKMLRLPMIGKMPTKAKLDEVVQHANEREAEGRQINSLDSVWYVRRVTSPSGLKAHRMG